MSERNYAGADWLARQFPALVISEHGRRVADILGEAYEGLYHLDDSALFHKRTQWNDDRLIEIVVRGRLTMFKLVVIVEKCRAHKIQLQLDGASNGFLRLFFYSEM